MSKTNDENPEESKGSLIEHIITNMLVGMIMPELGLKTDFKPPNKEEIIQAGGDPDKIDLLIVNQLCNIYGTQDKTKQLISNYRSILESIKQEALHHPDPDKEAAYENILAARAKEIEVMESSISQSLNDGIRESINLIANELGVSLDTPRKNDNLSAQIYPAEIPQQTFQEVKAIGVALTDGPTGRYWKEAEGGTAMIHTIPGWAIQTKFDPAILPDLWGKSKPSTPNEMKEWLKKGGPKAVLLVQIALGCALTMPNQPVSIDWIVDCLFDPRSTAERNEKREWVWEMLLVAANMAPHGRRFGKWSIKEGNTKKEIDVYIDDPLIRLGPPVKPVQSELFADGVPVAIPIQGGLWMDKFKGNEQILSFFGNVLQIADIPAGKPSGAWAQCIGLNLNQWWREKSTTAIGKNHTRFGSDGSTKTVPTVKYNVKEKDRLTRRYLLTGESKELKGFCVEPQYSIEKIFNSKDPGRAKKYWIEAVKELKSRGIISINPIELETLPENRKGWKDAWLDQPLDIRPGRSEIKKVLEIASSAKQSIRKRGRPKKAE